MAFSVGAIEATLRLTFTDFLNGLRTAQSQAQQTRAQLERTLTVPLRVDPGAAAQTLTATSAQASTLRTALESVRQAFLAMASQGTTKSLEAFQALLTTTLPELQRLRQDLAQLPTPEIDTAPLDNAEQVLSKLQADLASGEALRVDTTALTAADRVLEALGGHAEEATQQTNALGQAQQQAGQKAQQAGQQGQKAGDAAAQAGRRGGEAWHFFNQRVLDGLKAFTLAQLRIASVEQALTGIKNFLGSVVEEVAGDERAAQQLARALIRGGQQGTQSYPALLDVFNQTEPALNAIASRLGVTNRAFQQFTNRAVEAGVPIEKAAELTDALARGLVGSIGPTERLQVINRELQALFQGHAEQAELLGQRLGAAGLFQVQLLVATKQYDQAIAFVRDKLKVSTAEIASQERLWDTIRTTTSNYLDDLRSSPAGQTFVAELKNILGQITQDLKDHGPLWNAITTGIQAATVAARAFYETLNIAYSIGQKLATLSPAQFKMEALSGLTPEARTRLLAPENQDLLKSILQGQAPGAQGPVGELREVNTRQMLDHVNRLSQEAQTKAQAALKAAQAAATSAPAMTQAKQALTLAQAALDHAQQAKTSAATANKALSDGAAQASTVQASQAIRLAKEAQQALGNALTTANDIKTAIDLTQRALTAQTAEKQRQVDLAQALGARESAQAQATGSATQQAEAESRAKARTLKAEQDLVAAQLASNTKLLDLYQRMSQVGTEVSLDQVARQEALVQELKTKAQTLGIDSRTLGIERQRALTEAQLSELQQRATDAAALSEASAEKILVDTRLRQVAMFDLIGTQAELRDKTLAIDEDALAGELKLRQATGQINAELERSLKARLAIVQAQRQGLEATTYEQRVSAAIAHNLEMLEVFAQGRSDTLTYEVGLFDLQLEAGQEFVRMRGLSAHREQEILQILQAETRARQNSLRMEELDLKIADAIAKFQQQLGKPGTAEEIAKATEEYNNQVNSLSQQISLLTQANELLQTIAGHAKKLREVEITRQFGEDLAAAADRFTSRLRDGTVSVRETLMDLSTDLADAFLGPFKEGMGDFIKELATSMRQTLTGALGGPWATLAMGGIGVGIAAVGRLMKDMSSQVERLGQTAADQIQSTEHTRGLVAGDSALPIQQISQALSQAMRRTESLLAESNRLLAQIATAAGLPIQATTTGGTGGYSISQEVIGSARV